MSRPIRVQIVDDHQLIRQALRAVLDDEGLCVVAESADGEAALADAARTQPDVVLMDLSMPAMSGERATAALQALPNPPRVVVLTSYTEESRVQAALTAGAVGYLLKDSEPETIVGAVRAAHAGGAPLDPRVAATLLPSRGRATLPTPSSSVPASLTPRETEVLTLLGHGLANKQIASRLGITEATVKAHLSSIFRQTNTTDRTSAALWARDHGL